MQTRLAPTFKSSNAIVMFVGPCARYYRGPDLGSVWSCHYNLITVLVGSRPIEMVFHEAKIAACNLIYRFSLD